jgi:hypothetical protein
MQGLVGIQKCARSVFEASHKAYHDNHERCKVRVSFKPAVELITVLSRWFLFIWQQVSRTTVLAHAAQRVFTVAWIQLQRSYTRSGVSHPRFEVWGQKQQSVPREHLSIRRAW